MVLTQPPSGSSDNSGIQVFFYLSHSSSLKPILLCYLGLQVKVDIFTLTSVFLVCIFFKTMLVFHIDSGGSVTAPALHCPSRDYGKKYSISARVWVGSYVRRVKNSSAAECWSLKAGCKSVIWLFYHFPSH